MKLTINPDIALEQVVNDINTILEQWFNSDECIDEENSPYAFKIYGEYYLVRSVTETSLHVQNVSLDECDIVCNEWSLRTLHAKLLRWNEQRLKWSQA